MDLRKTSNLRYPINAIRICIDRLEKLSISGRVYSKLSKEPILFGNCSEMLLKIDDLFNKKGYPQTFQDKRRFDGQADSCYVAMPAVEMTDHELSLQDGDMGVFDLVVTSRQKASWQGLLWMSSPDLDQIMIPFRSEMELLNIIVERMKR